MSKAILKLAQQINAVGRPEYVAVEPATDCSPDNSFENVIRFVKRQGGSIQTGWRLREIPQVYVEGILHAVWRGKNGRLIDITPHPDNEPQILFLCDSKTKWEGEAVEPRRTLLHLQPCYCGSALPFKVCHGLNEG